MRNKKAAILTLGTAVMMAMGVSFTAMADNGQWKQENSTWACYEDGSRVRDTWKKSGDNWFYLNSEGYMVKNAMVGDKYVNEAGAMVSNEWHKVYQDGEDHWYYFGNKGSAVTGWNTVNGKKFNFEESGAMNYGWFDDNQYYLGGEDDGAMRVGWHNIDGPEDSELGDEESSFYFAGNGKLIKDNVSRSIGKYTYAFDQDGRMLYGWVDIKNKVMGDDDSASSELSDYRYFKDETLKSGIDGSRMTGWKKMDGPERVMGDYDEDTWFYFKNGEPYAAKVGDEYDIRAVNGKKYCFDENGVMQYGLLEMASSENTASPSDAKPANTKVYYFGKAGDGAMKTGIQTVYDEEDGERYTYYFNTKGDGVNGIKDDCVYINGRRMEADRDRKYQAVSDGEHLWLVNTGGKIQKSYSATSDKKFTDNDGNEFMVNRNGEITSALPGGYEVKTHK